MAKDYKMICPNILDHHLNTYRISTIDIQSAAEKSTEALKARGTSRWPNILLDHPKTPHINFMYFSTWILLDLEDIQLE